MEWAKVALLLGVSALSVLMGIAVLLSDRKRLSNSLFFLVMLSMAGWCTGVGIFLLVDNPAVAIWCAKIFYAFPLLIGWSLFTFAMVFPDRKKVNPLINASITVWLLLLLGLIFGEHDFIVRGLVTQEWGKEIVLNYADYTFYSMYLLLCFVGTLGIMFYKMHHKKGTYASQASLFFYGFLITFFIGILFNLLLPWFGNYRLIWIGPNCVAIFTSAIAYSIVRHKMFNVRLFIARTLGYALSIATLAIIYSFLVFNIVGQFIFTTDPASFTEQLFYIFFATIIAFTFQPFRKFYDRITNVLFYRDAYDPQIFLDQLNKTLVSNIELRILLRRTAQVIENNLKCTTCFVAVQGSESAAFRLVGAESPTFGLDEIEFACTEELPQLNQKLIVTDDLGRSHRRLRKILDTRDIALVCAPSASEPGRPALAYLMLGPKKSGNVYTKQDMQIIEIITDELVIAIQNALRFEEIQTFNATLQARINEATNKLQRSNNKLQVLDQTKDEFISMASHQLRTPLTSIKGYLSMVLEGDAGQINPEQQKMLQQAFISSQRMTYLISDLLNVSRLKTGKFVIEQNSMDLAAVVQQEVDQLKESAKIRNLTLAYDRPKDFPALRLDETKVRQVVMNFLDNAIYYTRDGGRIVVELADKPKSIELTVTDDGIGVPKAHQHHLFTKFYRASNAKKARPDGTGLGLFMAKKIIVAQGGALIFKSQEGKGSTFGFSFPKTTTSR